MATQLNQVKTMNTLRHITHSADCYWCQLEVVLQPSKALIELLHRFNLAQHAADGKRAMTGVDAICLQTADTPCAWGKVAITFTNRHYVGQLSHSVEAHYNQTLLEYFLDIMST